MSETEANAVPAGVSSFGPRPRRRWTGWLVRGAAAGLLVALLLEAGNVLVGRNLHPVIPGRVYRCAQPSGAGLEQMVSAQGIRTVVNLRGCCAPWAWYLDECRVTRDRNVTQEDVALSAYRLPSVHEVHRLLEVLERSAYPILLHCRRGSDRTGLASTVVLLLQTDTDVAQARHQLGLRYGHVALGRPAYLDRFFDLYGEWLGRQGLSHSRATFRRWLEEGYCPGECRCTLELLEAPARVSCGQPFAMRMRSHNTGTESWNLRAGDNTGIHAGFKMFDGEGHELADGRSGMFDARVAPGQSIDLTVVLPALSAPGHYRVLLDMVDEHQCWFFQTGSEPLEQELEAHEEGTATAH